MTVFEFRHGIIKTLLVIDIEVARNSSRYIKIDQDLCDLRYVSGKSDRNCFYAKQPQWNLGQTVIIANWFL